jgi:hypothetical protein
MNGVKHWRRQGANLDHPEIVLGTLPGVAEGRR